MADFEDVYSESGVIAQFRIGGGNLSGRLVVDGLFEKRDHHGTETAAASMIVADAKNASLKLGDRHTGLNGRIDIGDEAVVIDGGDASITLGGKSLPAGRVSVNSRGGDTALSLDGLTAMASFGSTGLPGVLVLKGNTNQETVRIDGRHGNADLGGNGADGDIKLNIGSGQTTISMNADGGAIVAGGGTKNGTFTLKNADGTTTCLLSGATGNLTLGGGNQDGDLILRSALGLDSMTLNGAAARFESGGNGTSGVIQLKAGNGEARVEISASGSSIIAGGNGSGGDIALKTSAGNTTVFLDANNGAITAGGEGANGDVIVKNSTNVETIRMVGSSGDLQFLNADFAEEFDIDSSAIEFSEPGTLMVLEPSGLLRPSGKAYDRMLIGIVAGAGDYRPALILDKKGGPSRMPIAMIGKVCCKATASNGPIQTGDLLTSSDLAGHAMRASDRDRAFGAVIGKALGPLPEGEGLIPVLVNLL